MQVRIKNISSDLSRLDVGRHTFWVALMHCAICKAREPYLFSDTERAVECSQCGHPMTRPDETLFG